MQRFILVLLFIIPLNISVAQLFRREPPPFISAGMYFEGNFLPGDTGTLCFISYRIAYDQLVFIKENGKFSARYSITVEASDSLNEKFKREISERYINVSTYEQTVDERSYVQGVLKLSLSNGNFKILPIVSDINAAKEYRQRPIFINTGIKNSGLFLDPIIVSEKKQKCGKDSSHILCNYQGDVLFSPDKYNLLIPVKDSSVHKLELQIKNNDSLFSKITLDKFYTGTFQIEECEDVINFNMLPGNLRFFYHPAFNLPLKEGKLEISVWTSNSAPQIFHKFVSWFNKPKSLFRTELAIKILKYMVDDSDLSELKRVSDKEAYKALFEFWQKYDPTPQTSFNELMSEYYERVDYSIKNFSIVGSVNGAETDRGKIYIIYGKPDNIQRVYTDSNNIKEIWTYSDNQKFVFTDKTGLGNFILSAL